MKKIIVIAMFCCRLTMLALAGDIYHQEEMTVRGSRSGPVGLGEASYPGESVFDNLSEVTISSQGGVGGQQDISIRGSTFSGAGISVEGLALNNAQTEHFNAELPFFLSVFSAPVVRSGFDQALTTEGFLVGSVDLRIQPVESASRLSGGIGEYSSGWLRGRAGMPLHTNMAGGTFAAGVFGGIERFNHVNYDDNDNHSEEAGGQLQWRAQGLQVDLLSGYKNKRFGARGYYGVNPQYDADEELRDRLTILSLRRSGGRHTWSGAVAYRKLDDDYKLYLPQSLYHNEHTTKTMSGQVGGYSVLSLNALALNWRLSGVEESIDSASLGDHRRSRAALTLVPSWRHRSVEFFAGLRQEVFEHEEPATLPQAGIEWTVSDFQIMRLSFSRSIRQPSYTELNYESPASFGNQGLDNQEADELSFDWSLETGKMSLRAGLFARQTRDTIDWVYADADSTRWSAENIGTVKTYGSEASAGWALHETLFLHADAIVLDKQNDAEFYSSRYAMDYDRFNMRIKADWKPVDRVDAALSQGCRIKADNPLRTGSDDQWIGTLSLGYDLIPGRNMRLSFIVDNLWNTYFQTFPGQDTATGRRFYVSASATF